MRTVSITVTEASRKFADCINRVRYQGTTFLLHKNGVAVARLAPERKPQTENELEDGPREPIAAKEEAPSEVPSPSDHLRRGIW